MGTTMGSHVIEVRQGLYEDVQQKDATRVFPWTDIQYAGAEVAASNSVLASCLVPIVAGVTLDKNSQGLEQPEVMKLHGKGSITAYARNNKTERPSVTNLNSTKWMQTGFGMCDYLFGITQQASLKSVLDVDGSALNKARLKLYAKPTGRSTIEGTAPLEIKQYMSEDEALDEITAFPARMIVGFVIGPRDVKLYYTETAIAMMVRRMRRVIEALGPQKPTYYPLGLGHLEINNKPWTPEGVPGEGRKGGGGVPTIRAPSGVWNAGAVQYKSNAIKATGSLYIPWDQTPYSTMRRNFKYNHVMTQVGMELLETLTAVGIDMSEELKGNGIKAFNENGEGAQVAGLQMLFASMFGTTTTHNATSDFVVDETSIASGLKDRLGMLFNSGHIHIDPGVFSFERRDKTNFLTPRGKKVGMLTSATDNDLEYKGVKGVSAEMLYKEFIAKYITFNVAAACLENYFAVPLYQCHWLYVGSPKPEYVTEQLQMNFRSDVYFDGGDSQLPFTLIPSLLNPGQVLSRIPCYLDIGNQTLESSGRAQKGKWINTYLGVRDPLPYGTVTDIRYSGDRPLTTVEERDYTFTPVIEADASVQTQYRNSRTVNCAIWPRPSVYSPGATRMGAIYGLMSDNSGVGGHYYYQPLTGTLLNDGVQNILYRTMTNDSGESKQLAKQLFKGQGREEIKEQGKYWSDHSIDESKNPQNTGAYTEAQLRKLAAANPVEPSVFPTTVSGSRTKNSKEDV